MEKEESETVKIITGKICPTFEGFFSMYSIQKRAQVKIKGKYYKSQHKKWQQGNVKKPSQMVCETISGAILGDVSAPDISVHLEQGIIIGRICPTCQRE